MHSKLWEASNDRKSGSDKIQLYSQSAAIGEKAASHLARAEEQGLISDWGRGFPKTFDFARLIQAAADLLPAGGSIETGVFRGGSSGPLILCASTDSFHVTIDPFGLGSQHYQIADYRDWGGVRTTLARLAVLAEEQNVTHCHYLTDSLSFIRADLLQHNAPFRIVHLDGDHSEHVVAEELSYFRSKIEGPALFILDDHDDNFPGVEAGLEVAGDGMVMVLHLFYDWPGCKFPCGFSAWLHAQ